MAHGLQHAGAGRSSDCYNLLRGFHDVSGGAQLVWPVHGRRVRQCHSHGAGAMPVSSCAPFYHPGSFLFVLDRVDIYVAFCLLRFQETNISWLSDPTRVA